MDLVGRNSMPYSLHRINQLSLYLEVFSFKLRAAWSDLLENYISGAQKNNKHNLCVYILYINVIISYCFRVCSQHGAWMNMPPSFIFVIVKVLSIAAVIGLTIPCGSTEIEEHIKQRHPSWLTHSRSPRSMEFETILLHFLHNTDVNILYRLFGNRKYMYIYLPIHQEYGFLGKQKISLYFQGSTCENL